MTNVPWTWPLSTVTRVIDGDSFTARVTRDLGFHGIATFDVKLRLNRINAPPIGTDAGKGAKAAFEALVLRPSSSLPFLLTIETVKAYKYGDEWMAEITLSGPPRNVSDELVKQGVAVYWDGTGPRPGG
jgi:endonuclease YncB( thermonuclease family)